MVGTAVNSFGCQLNRAILGQLSPDGQNVELEMSMTLKVKTTLGARGFNFKTEEIDVGNKFTESTVNSENGQSHFKWDRNIEEEN